MELTRSEMEIMDVLWDADVPLSRSDLLDRSEQKRWKDSSVHILLNGLLNKGAITEVGFVKRSKTYGRTFSATLSREEYFAQLVFSYKCKPDSVSLFKALIEQPDVSLDQIEQMIKIAAEKR